MKIIGLTGGIGCGKSTASKYLMNNGYVVLDADKISREIVMPGSKVLATLTQTFGQNILDENGSLNRKKLADIVFNEEKQREKLDGIMLKEILNDIAQKIEQLKKINESIVFIDAALLFETKLHENCDETWVIDVPDNIRIQRVVQRDNVKDSDVIARINAQMSSLDKNKKATFVLDNSKTEEDLYKQIAKLLK